MRTRSMRNHQATPRMNQQPEERQETLPENYPTRQVLEPHRIVVAEETRQDEIHRLYANVKSAPSYSSKIADFLRQHETSSLHKRIRKKFKRRKTIAYYPYDVCMADLAFYNSRDFVYANGGIKYILVFIDVFTKMCYVEVMKDKNALTTLLALENIFRKLPSFGGIT